MINIYAIDMAICLVIRASVGFVPEEKSRLPAWTWLTLFVSCKSFVGTHSSRTTFG